MSFARRTKRRAVHDYTRMMEGGSKGTGPDGKPTHVLGSSQLEAVAFLRALPIPPAAPGSPDSDRDSIDPVQYRRDRNARKRARRDRGRS